MSDTHNLLKSLNSNMKCIDNIYKFPEFIVNNPILSWSFIGLQSSTLPPLSHEHCDGQKGGCGMTEQYFEFQFWYNGMPSVFTILIDKCVSGYTIINHGFGAPWKSAPSLYL